MHPTPEDVMTQQAWPSTEPTEVVLAAGDARLAIDLVVGASAGSSSTTGT